MIKCEFDDLVSMLADPLTNNFMAGLIDKERSEITRFLRVPLDTGFVIISRRKYVIIDIQTEIITEKQKEEYAKIIGLVAYSTAMPVELYVISTVEETQHMEYVFNEKTTFDINVVSLKYKNADDLFAKIKDPNSKIVRQDVVHLVFAPLMSSSCTTEQIIVKCVSILCELKLSEKFKYIVFILQITMIERLINDFKLKEILVEMLLMRWDAYNKIVDKEIEKTKKEIANKMLDEGIDSQLVSKIVEIEDI